MMHRFIRSPGNVTHSKSGMAHLNVPWWRAARTSALLSQDATTDKHGAIGSGAAKSEMAWSVGTPRMLLRMRQFGFGCTKPLVIRRKTFWVPLMLTGVAFSPTEVSLDGAFTAWQTLTVGWGKTIGSNAPILTEEGPVRERIRRAKVPKSALRGTVKKVFACWCLFGFGIGQVMVYRAHGAAKKECSIGG